MATEKERQEFIARFCAEYTDKDRGYTLQQCIDAARALLRHARTHGNLAVQQCNGPERLNGPSPYDWRTQPAQHKVWITLNGVQQAEWETQRERKELACEKRIKEICAAFNLPVAFGGDPRGATVRVHFPSKCHNSWGGESDGWSVPQ